MKGLSNIMSTIPQSSIVASNLPEELNESETRDVYKNLQKLSAWINQQEKVESVQCVSQSVLSPEGDVNQFNVRLNVKTDNTIYDASSKDRDFLESLNQAINEIKKQVRRED
jgi:ribosome-associated translation inhibitor RaiA